MAWIVPRDWVASEVVTASIMNSAVRDNLRYLKGLDGDITLEANILTTFNVDGVDVSSHEARHVLGGADDIDSALAIAAMSNLTQDKIWQGNVSNRPIEVAFPSKTLSAANETVEAGYYEATTLSAVDADLTAGNIKLSENIFGFIGTFRGTQLEDIVGNAMTAFTSNASAGTQVVITLSAGAEQDIASKTQTYDATSMAVAVGFFNCDASAVSAFKLRLYMDGVQVAESAFFTTDSDNYILVATRALSGSTICKIALHNYDSVSRAGDSCTKTMGSPIAAGIGIGSIKLA